MSNYEPLKSCQDLAPVSDDESKPQSKHWNPKFDLLKARFVQALAECNGSSADAYIKLNPHITNRDYACHKGKELLRALNKDDVQTCLERIGCTRDVVVSHVWQRLKNTKKDSDYFKGASVLSKISGLELKDVDRKDIDKLDQEIITLVKKRVRDSLKGKQQDDKDVIDIEAKISSEDEEPVPDLDITNTGDSA